MVKGKIPAAIGSILPELVNLLGFLIIARIGLS